MPSSSSRQFAQHVRVSSTEDLSYNIPTGNGGTQDVIQTIVTGRKCWKTMKGKGEVVWPPHLEAALVEGLEQYRPVETRSTRALGRFPMRNKFISEYIFKTTGKRRTPKQVGSRLQQLRDTCEGKRILKLLSSRPADPPKVEEPAPPAPEPPAPISDQVTIDVLPANSYWPSGDVGSIPSPSPSNSSAHDTFRPSNIPRPLRAIDPTVTFRSGSPINAYSSFRVLRDGACIHRESTELEMRSSSCIPAPQWPSEMECIYYYSTRLVPRLWASLCEKNDLNAYKIEQDIVRKSSTAESGGSSTSSNHVMLSVAYNFKTVSTPTYSPPSPTSTVVSTGGSADADNLSYSTASTPELTGEFDDFLTTFHDPSRSNGHSYGHQEPSPHLPTILPPFHTLQSQLQNPASVGAYDLPPDLIRDGEDGYNSLPQSPLDFAFPSAISSNAVGGSNVVVADTSVNELGGIGMGRGYIGSVPVDAHSPGCYPHDLGVSVGAASNVSLLQDMSYHI